MEEFDGNKIIESINKMLNPDNWPIPEWLKNNKKTISALNTDDYKYFFLQDLRGKYVLLETDFRTILPLYIEQPKFLDLPSSEILYNHIQAARTNLEQDDLAPIMMVNELDFIQRLLIWIYPAHLLKPKAASIKLKLKMLKPLGWKYFLSKLDKILLEDLPENCSIDLGDFPNDKLYSIRSILDETIGACNEQFLDGQINAGLQISRLKEIRKWGLIMLFTVLAFTPLITNSSIFVTKFANSSIIKTEIINGSIFFNVWNYNFMSLNLYIKIFSINPYIILILLALSVVLIGASGGFLSGLMDIRGSKTDFAKYHESLIRTQLKPIVGGLAALLIYIFISYDTIAGITFNSLGAIFVAAFVSGFSERFFLRLLDIQIDEEKKAIEAESSKESNRENVHKKTDDDTNED